MRGGGQHGDRGSLAARGRYAAFAFRNFLSRGCAVIHDAPADGLTVCATTPKRRQLWTLRLRQARPLHHGTDRWAMGAAERGNDPPLQSMVLARTFIVPRRCP